MRALAMGPNPRVQRTRPSASRRASPLTRHPLGVTETAGWQSLQYPSFAFDFENNCAHTGRSEGTLNRKLINIRRRA